MPTATQIPRIAPVEAITHKVDSEGFNLTLIQRITYDLVYINPISNSAMVFLPANQKMELQDSLEGIIEKAVKTEVTFTPDLIKQILDNLKEYGIIVGVNEFINYLHPWLKKEKSVKLELRGFKDIFNDFFKENRYRPDIELKNSQKSQLM